MYSLTNGINTSGYKVLNLRTICRKYSKCVFQRFPLNNEASSNFNQEILTLLSKWDNVSWRLLHWAAFCGYERVAQRLLEKGADVECRSNGGQTPLRWAAEKGHEAVVNCCSRKGPMWSVILAIAGHRCRGQQGTGTRRW
jgi:hypothetical protein